MPPSGLVCLGNIYNYSKLLNCCSRNFYQFFMICMYLGGLLWRPVVYIMMPRKLKGLFYSLVKSYFIPDTYTDMFNGLTDYMEEKGLYRHEDMTMICDWE